ncbi:MAG: hypothetical protein IPP91_13995 [Betaproteobacteria bacterium]|nr:hypothetical protein [Betaproteobacteria bacterium]
MKRFTLLAVAAAIAFTLPACASGVGSLARITVFDRTANRELPVHWKDGRAFVAGQPGNEYQIRVRNVAGEDLLAVVSVDGVNAITGQSAAATQSGYVLASYASMDVSGWRKSMQRTAAFYFTTLPDSYAARTGRPDDVGVIGVALFKRKPAEPVAVEPYRPMPFSKQESSGGSASPAAPAAAAPAERAESRDSVSKRTQSESPLGTGHGRVETNPTRWTDFERASPYPVETISIYYDSTRNLVAQGVIRAAPMPRDPNPFPGFVPDPVSSYRFWHRPPGA